MGQGRPSFSPEKTKSFKDEVCRTALRIISEQGQAALSFRVLASALGCSHTRVHGYFANKDEIIREVRDFAFGEFARALEATFADVEKPHDKLRLAGENYFRFAHEDPEAFYILFGGINPDKGLETENEIKAWNVIRNEVVVAVEEGRLLGDPDIVAHVFWTAIHGVTQLSLSGNIKQGVCAHEVLGETLAGLRRAFGKNVE